ncbi:RloB family protein [Rheinheimera sp. 4Y26]|uniref:RloB family protein n=1 Tax=Rheinheimera sp. 4Y26 TaxID=2977811 RepID=UPI0021B0B3E1|nr:RloB family protein [Rheinheimera sp. 4Y26]MCT6700883.1 RloB family protein [Rheinheimera sp. 4Y26]
MSAPVMNKISQISSARKLNKKQLDPCCFVLSAEGQDEILYFESLKKIIPRQFDKYYRLHVVKKTNVNHSAITHICRDLNEYIASGVSKFRKTKECSYVIFDHDSNFQANHIKNTLINIKECRQKNYITICSNPCFDLWLILHYIDITKTNDLEKILENKNNYVKQYLHRVRNNEDFSLLVRRYKVAIYNASKLVALCKDKAGSYPFACLKTEVVFLLEDIVDAGLLEC